MTALTTERNTPQYGSTADPASWSLPVAAATKIYQGSIVCDNGSGYATKGAVSTALIAVGRAEATVDNSTGDAGDKQVPVERGVFHVAQDASITIADRYSVCYILDDQTVTQTSGGSTRSIAGLVMDVDATGVWVAIGVANALSAAGADAKALQTISLNITDADLTDEDGSQSFDFGSALPANAVILGYDIRVAEAFTDGAAGTFTLDVGISGGDLDQLVDGAALGTIANIANAPGVRPTGRYGNITLAATVLGSVNVDTATAGDVTIEVVYAVL